MSHEKSSGGGPIPPITPTDTASIDLTVSGVDGHTLAADVNISATAGNVLVENIDGLYVPTPITSYSLDNCAGVPLASGSNVLSIADITAALGNDNPQGIIVAVPGACPTKLTVPLCDGVFNTQRHNMVLGARGTTTISWGRPDRSPMETFEVLDTYTISAEDGDIMWYRDAGVGNITLDPPPNNCVRNDLWFKNQSASNLVVTPSFGLIDGAANMTLTTNQSAHLVWNSQINEWMRF